MAAPVLKVFKTYSRGINTPAFGTEQAVCFDIEYSPYGKVDYSGFNALSAPITRKFGPNGELTIMPGDRILVPTGIIFDIPTGYSLRLHPRSGNAVKLGLTLINCEGVIDSDYFHETFITLLNASEIPAVIVPHQKMAQAELIKSLTYGIWETAEQPTQKTDRVGGFGSTDTK